MSRLLSKSVLIAVLGTVAFFLSPVVSASSASAAAQPAHATVSVQTATAHPQAPGHKRCCASLWHFVHAFATGAQCESEGRYYVDHYDYITYSCEYGDPTHGKYCLWVKYKSIRVARLPGVSYLAKNA